MNQRKIALVCPPVCGDNPRALASGLSHVQVDNHDITSLYHLHQFRPCTLPDINSFSSIIDLVTVLSVFDEQRKFW